ncbi:metalloregulator ArsR/SmtB family transcription factor [Paenibacillus silvisoli]|uniref:metalloregulator ArsR/SmtB family transcription factor n=1 Tax=Paenibacillus silvisoli TaxID=3110539 RepID=UPI0028053A69|nr:metalloregulator ArsR/SmtB family transcription factor [Paenibacillus silvisoli]
MIDRNWRDQLYNEFARIGKCLSSPKRLELLDLLSQGPKSVEQLGKMTGMSVANVSQHLQTLHESKLVRYNKRGNFVIYELADPTVGEFMVSMHRLGEKRLVEIQQMKSDILQAHASMEAITLDELRERMENGEVLLIDVRPSDEYAAGHIPGAISIPIEELDNHLDALPMGKEIVAYCRGPYCLMSAQAVERMNRHGIRASRLEEGVYEWKHYVSHATVRSEVL